MPFVHVRPADAAMMRDERSERLAVQAILSEAAQARIARILACPAISTMGRELRLARMALHAVPAETEQSLAVARAASIGLVTPARRVPIQASYAKTNARPHERQGDASIRRESVSEFTLEAKAGTATEAHGVARLDAAARETLPVKATPRAFYSNRATAKARIVR